MKKFLRSLKGSHDLNRSYKFFYIRNVSLIIASIIVFSSIKPAKASDLSIAVVDLQQLMNDSIAAKDIQKQIKEQRDSFQNKFSDVEKELHEKQKKLSEEHSQLPQDQFAKKREDFEEQFIEARLKVQKSKRALDEGVLAASDQLRGKILNIVAKISEKDGYDLVLARQNVVLVSKETDITSQVMKELNESVKAIKVSIDKK